MDQSIKPASPKWGRSTKIIVAVSLLALTVAVIIRFQELFPPLIMALIIAYLFYPTASFLERRARMPWGLSVTLIYLVLALIIIGLLALGGFEIVSQIQSLIDAIQSLLEQLPVLLDSLKLQVIVIGPYTYDLSSLGIDLSGLSDQLINSTQAVLRANWHDPRLRGEQRHQHHRLDALYSVCLLLPVDRKRRVARKNLFLRFSRLQRGCP